MDFIFYYFKKRLLLEIDSFNRVYSNVRVRRNGLTMVEKQPKPLGYVRKVYTKVADKYNNVVEDSPHHTLKKEQKMFFGFGGETFGLLMLYFSLVHITSFSLLTVMGLIGLFVSIGIIKYSSKLMHSAIE